MKVAELFEERKSGIVYVEKKVKGQLDRVTAELKGHPSSVWTKLTQEYVALEAAVSALSEQRNEINARLKDKAAELFDAEDMVLTRVVETCQLTITLSKKTRKEASEKVDAEAVVKALREMDLVPELKALIDDLVKANTKLIEASDVPEKLTVKVTEGLTWNKVVQFIGKVVSKVMTRLKGVDADINELKDAVAAL